MTIPQPEGEVPAVVTVGRTIGGVILVTVGVVMILAGAFWFFLVPWFGWAMEGFWFQMAEWADLGGAGVGILGFLLLIVGGTLIQRARRKRLEIFMDAAQFTPATPEPEPPQPRTIL